jgi:hypothetical protein
VPILERTPDAVAAEIARLQPHMDMVNIAMAGLPLNDRALILGCVVGGIAMAADEDSHDVGLGTVFVNAVHKIAQSWSNVKK